MKGYMSPGEGPFDGKFLEDADSNEVFQGEHVMKGGVAGWKRRWGRAKMGEIWEKSGPNSGNICKTLRRNVNGEVG